jgi:hypothetical protein
VLNGGCDVILFVRPSSVVELRAVYGNRNAGKNNRWRRVHCLKPNRFNMTRRIFRRLREFGMRETASRVFAEVQGALQMLRRRFPDPGLIQTALVVRDRTGKSLTSQVREIAALARGPGRLYPFDYYAYELFDDHRYSFAEKAEFVSWHWNELKRLNDAQWIALCDDKLISYTLLRGFGFPFPELYAVYHPGGRTAGPTPVLHTPAEMAAFLREKMCYPFFGKPVRDWRGGGASSVASIDRERDVLIMAGGSEVPVDEYVATVPVRLSHGEKLRAQQPGGYLFQARIVQHPDIDRLSGGRVTSLRLVVLLDGAEPILFRATWKLAVGTNITDHVIGTSGNVKCSVDPATGRVERVLLGLGPKGTAVYALGHYGTPIEVHPDTGERLSNIRLPDWDRAVSLCLQAARAFPRLLYQSWDLVFGAEGPLFLEINHHGGILQVPGCKGLNDATFRRFRANLKSR